jgi:hypothetical protein
MQRTPSPRARRDRKGHDSTIPVGFTFGRHTRKDGKVITAWRCGELSQNPLTGEWRRCSILLEKRDCLRHQLKGKHIFDISRDDDPEFPPNFDQRRERIGLQRGIDRLNAAQARFVARANLAVHDTRPLNDFVSDIATIAVQLHETCARFDPASLPRITATTLTRRIRSEGTATFDRILDNISGRIRYVNLLTDSGTVLAFNTLHAVLTNPNYSDVIIPLDTYENRNFTSDDYGQFFQSVITEIQARNLEIVAVICDNCAAQVNGVAQALAFLPTLGITHMPCLNHMVNLVFVSALSNSNVMPRLTVVNEFIADLQSSDSISILGSKCPRLIQTRWVYLVDTLEWMLRRLDNVNTVRAIIEHPPLPESLKTLYQILLPLKLFSLSMEARCRKLYEVLPIVKEICRQFTSIRQQLVAYDDLAILDNVTAQFLARLQANEFETIITAWAVSTDGREHIRGEEMDFLTRFNYRCRLRFPILESVAELRKAFSEHAQPWDQAGRDTIPEFGDISAQTIEEMLPSQASRIDPFHYSTESGRHRDTPAAHRHLLFLAKVREQSSKTLTERLSQRLDVRALHTAIATIRKVSEALELDPDQIEQKYREWLFTLNVPDSPADTEQHWREVHSLGPEWCGLARIGLRYASMGTSEAEVERLLREQKHVQGMHGTNYGTETLHARLVLRHDNPV